jgi:hypothetical protein
MKFVFFILAAAQILVLFASIVALVVFVIRRIFKAYMALGNAQTTRLLSRPAHRDAPHTQTVAVEGRR